MIVIDASSFVDFTLQPARVPDVVNAIAANATLAAPALVDFEFLHVIRKHLQNGRITAVQANAALALFQDLNIDRFTGPILADRIWQLRHNLTAYDAAYIALAEMLGVSFYTGDRKLANSSGHGAAVVLCAPAP